VTGPLQPPIFLFGAARTGTTLLQRLLNSYDDVLIWGEHAGMLEPVAEAFYRGWENPHLFRDRIPLAEVLADSRPAERFQAWLGWYGREEWTAAFRTLIERLFVPDGLPGKHYWGFKEIRYMSRPEDRTLDLLRLLYPDALYVFIVRNPYNALASTKRLEEGAHTLRELRALCERWRSRYEAYRRVHEADRTRSFWVVYEELLEGRGDALRLLARLGKTLGDPQRAILQASDGRGSSFRDDDVHARWKRLPATWLAVITASLGPLVAALGYSPPPHAASYRLLGALLIGALGIAHPGARVAVATAPGETLDVARR
jgi:hypothetical protein